MGLFTDRCLNPACDQRVRKGSKFCPKCGGAAPKGLTKCGRCGAEVRTSSKFCWSCGTELGAAARPVVLHERWARQPGDFGVRVDQQDVRGLLVKPLTVEHGTRALLFQSGRCKGDLPEGRYDMEGLLARLRHFLIDQHASVVLVDAGDVTIDLENDDLWTTDPFEVGTCQRLVLRIASPDSLFVNLFKGQQTIGLDALECRLADEVQMLLAGIVGHYKASDLFANLALRGQIEAQLRDHLASTLSRLGLELVQLRFVSFTGEAYEQLREQRQELTKGQAEAALGEERAKLNQRLRQTLGQEQMDQFKSGKDLEEFIRQTEHELGLREVVRQDEMERLTRRFEFERNREDVLRRIEVEGIQDDTRRETAWKELLAQERERDGRQQRDLDRRLAESTNAADRRKVELEARSLEHEQDMREAEAGLVLLQKTRDIEHQEDVRQQELEARRLQERSKATVEALLSIVDGPAADRLAHLEKLRREKDLTPDQVLALAASASPSAAAALAKKYEAEGHGSASLLRQLQQQATEQRQLTEGYADRMERLMSTALGQMGGVASTRARPVDPKQTVVAGGGLGPPVVVNTPSPAAGPRCQHCGAALGDAAAFCSQCGKKP